MAIRYLLDTNICIYIAKHNPPKVRERFDALSREEVAMSVITLGELQYGAEKSKTRQKSLDNLRRLMDTIQILPIPPGAGIRYGMIRADLERKGQTIGNNDLWIAAHALSANVILVTNNHREFSRIDGLCMENWTG